MLYDYLCFVQRVILFYPQEPTSTALGAGLLHTAPRAPHIENAWAGRMGKKTTRYFLPPRLHLSLGQA